MSGRNLELSSLKRWYSSWQLPLPCHRRACFSFPLKSWWELSLWLWAFTWIRNTKIDRGILIQLVCAWSILIFRCCVFSQQNPTSFVVWFKWCSVNEQLSNILHFILTVILFMKHFTKGDLPVLLRILRATEMKILSLKKLLKYYTTTARQLIAHLSFSLLYRLN